MRQSFDIFNTFGKDPAAVENIQLGFFLALENKDPQRIQWAFKEWMLKNSKMPTPADILALVESEYLPGMSEETKQLIAARNATKERERKRIEDRRKSEKPMSKEEFDAWWMEQKSIMVGAPPKIPSPEEIEDAKTDNGGWTQETLREWGIPWPPPQGWKEDLKQKYKRSKNEN